MNTAFPFSAKPETAASFVHPSPPLVAEYTPVSTSTSDSTKWSVDTTIQDDLKDLMHTFQTYQEQGQEAFASHEEFMEELFAD